MHPHDSSLLKPEFPRIDPFIFQDGPPIESQAFEHILVGEPLIDYVVPPCSPEIPDHERPGRGDLLRDLVADLLYVFLSDGHNRVPAQKLFSLARERN